MKAIILAAAAANRLQPFDETRPKCMLPVLGKPLLERTIEGLAGIGVHEILIVINHHKNKIINNLNIPADTYVEWIEQDDLDGTGAALALCEPHITSDSEHFIVLNGSVLARRRMLNGLMHQHMQSGLAVAALSLPPHSIGFGNVYIDQDMSITRLIDNRDDPNLSNYVLSGAFILNRSFFKVLQGCNHDIYQAMQKIIAEKKLKGSIWEGAWIDIRLPWDILRANQMLMEGWRYSHIDQSVRLEGHVYITGPVHIEAGVSLKAGAVVRGPAYIGKNSFIGNNALIREHTVLGKNTIVGYGSELTNCEIFDSTMIGRLSFIGDSVIGENVNLGTGTTTSTQQLGKKSIRVEMLNETIDSGKTKLGAFVGDNVIIGPRQVLAPGTLIKSATQIEGMVTLRSNLRQNNT